MDSVGRNILELRRHMGLSQRALARRAGISPESLADIEAGRADPRTATVQRIAAAVGAPAAMLLGWTGHGAEDVVTMFQSLPPEDQGTVRDFMRFLVRSRIDRLYYGGNPGKTDGQEANN